MTSTQPPDDVRPEEAPLLTVRLDEQVVCTARADQLPVEFTPSVQLAHAGQALDFVDSQGGTRSFRLASLFDEGIRFLEMSVRVHASFAVQADAILMRERGDARESFASRDGLGIRLQPFVLPEGGGEPARMRGQGLFARGFHFPGLITPGNVSHLCLCDACGGTFRLQSFHAGFMDVAYFYCDRAPHTLTASGWLPDAPPALGTADPEGVRRFEAGLPPCAECGGRFAYLNPLRCPLCLEPYIDFPRHPEIRGNEYYGNFLYGRGAQHWDPSPPPSA